MSVNRVTNVKLYECSSCCRRPYTTLGAQLSPNEGQLVLSYSTATVIPVLPSLSNKEAWMPCCSQQEPLKDLKLEVIRQIWAQGRSLWQCDLGSRRAGTEAGGPVRNKWTVLARDNEVWRRAGVVGTRKDRGIECGWGSEIWSPLLEKQLWISDTIFIPQSKQILH